MRKSDIEIFRPCVSFPCCTLESLTNVLALLTREGSGNCCRLLTRGRDPDTPFFADVICEQPLEEKRSRTCHLLPPGSTQVSPRVLPFTRILLHCRLFSGYLYFEGGAKSGELFHNYTLEAIDVWNDCIKENSEEFCVNDPEKRKDFKVSSLVCVQMYNILVCL